MKFQENSEGLEDRRRAPHHRYTRGEEATSVHNLGDIGICLSIGGNLTFTVPCLMLILISALICLLSYRGVSDNRELVREVWRTAIYLITPISLFAVIL